MIKFVEWNILRLLLVENLISQEFRNKRNHLQSWPSVVLVTFSAEGEVSLYIIEMGNGMAALVLGEKDHPN